MKPWHDPVEMLPRVYLLIPDELEIPPPFQKPFGHTWPLIEKEPGVDGRWHIHPHPRNQFFTTDEYIEMVRIMKAIDEGVL